MAAESAISTAVQLLGDLLIQNVSFIRGIEGEVESLKDELNRMQSFLRDANTKRIQDDSARKWISEIREVAQDAVDTIQMFGVNVNSRKRKYGFMDRFSSLLNHSRIGEEIRSIHARLDVIDKSRERYGIKDLGESVGETKQSSEFEVRRRLAPWEKDEHLVGVEDDVKKLLEQITDEETEGLSVIAIVGMGGIGKTTLAREIFNHPDVVSGQFDCRGWVVVSSEFTPQETVKQLILETSSEQDKKHRLDEIKRLEETMRDGLYLESKLKKMLYEQLDGKSYFIVLDDVWKKEDLDSLITAFPKKPDKTSALLLTTRIKVIANQCQSFHEMRFLDSEKSWELFLKKGLTGNSNEEFPEEMEPTGREIVDKCEGLPLSITVIGGLLSEKRHNMGWEEALKELNSHLERAENSVSAILEAILELNYQNLSWELKCCFMCLAFFEEDATIPVKRLLNIMVGQCLIQGRTTPMVEEIARGYIDELINRNMVQVKDLTLDNRVKSCHLHDSLHSICLKKAKEEIGLEVLKADHGISLLRPRHCVIKWDDREALSMNQKKNIRSLFLLNVNFKEIKSSYWKSFQHLTTLDLDGYHSLQRLPDSFRLLVGLKQLRIHKHSYAPLLELPAWLNTHKKLEVLDIRAYQYVEFPNVALEMDSLRHIYANDICAPFITDSWKNVETLKNIRWEDWMKSSIRMIDDCHVRELGIVLDSSRASTASTFGHLKNLVKLDLQWYYGHTFDATIIPRLENLTKLKLFGAVRKCPSASLFPPNLSHLTLENSFIDEDPMQELGKLPKLSYLKLNKFSYWGERMQVLHDGFPSLRGLSMRALNLLRSVDVEDGGMPQLKLLQVISCGSLDTQNLSNKSYQLQLLT